MCERAPHERVCYPPPPLPHPRTAPPPTPPPKPHPHPAASPTIIPAMRLVHGAGQSIEVSVRADSLHSCCRIYWRSQNRQNSLSINVVNYVQQLLPFEYEARVELLKVQHITLRYCKDPQDFYCTVNVTLWSVSGKSCQDNF